MPDETSETGALGVSKRRPVPDRLARFTLYPREYTLKSRKEASRCAMHQEPNHDFRDLPTHHRRLPGARNDETLRSVMVFRRRLASDN
jgi:hypothetical protein